LGVLDALLADVDAGRSAVAIVSGEPGIGKTALIGAVLQRSSELGHEVLTGQASEIERDLPFAVFVEALEGSTQSLPPQRREQLADDELALLSTVFRGLAPVASAPQGGAHPDERHRVLGALQRLIELLADERPLVLALDDVHWADPASMDLICRLLHRGLANPSLVLLALRPGQSAARLRTAFDEAERHGKARQIELAPLCEADAGELLGTDLDGALADRLYRESGGIPFYLEQLAAARGRGETLRVEDGSAPPLPSVPAAVAATIRGELDQLSPSGRTLLQAAAVIGDPFEPDLAAATADMGEQDALRDLDELLERDLIRSTGSPRRFRFRHPIVCSAVYVEAGAGWRIQAHARAAELLRARGAAVTELAPHIERSARAGDGVAAAVLEEAGQELMRRAPASAARWFEAALGLAPERADNLDFRLGLTAQRAIALSIVGRFEEAGQALRRFLKLAPPQASELRPRAAVLAARCDASLGGEELGRALLREELALLPDQRGRDAADLKRELALTYHWQADWRETRRLASEALEADCQGLVRVGALAILALAELGLGNAGGWQQPLSEAAELFEHLFAEELATSVLDAAIYLAWAEVSAGRLNDGAHHAEQALARSRDAGHDSLMMPLLAMRGLALGWQGRASELASVAEAATESALLCDGDMYLSTAMNLRSWASLLAGNASDAARFAEGVMATATTSVSRAQAGALLAEALLAMGEPERCCAQFMGPEGDLCLPPLPPLDTRAYELLARARLALGDLAGAETAAQGARELAEMSRLDLPGAFASRALAHVLLARGESRPAIAEALASSEAAERVGAQVESARSLTLVGEGLAGCGDRPGAVTALRRAHEVCLDCGATRLAGEAARALRKLGQVVPSGKPGRNGTPDVLGLSAREREVMELVAAGKTNRAIAEDLVISVRTVDRHLSRIFDKLHVSSRAAATSTFERAQNDPPA